MRIASILVWPALIAGAGFAMFQVTFSVEALEGELIRLNRQIIAEREATHVLRAEWSYLNRPERLAALSRELLPTMHPPATKQIVSVESLRRHATPATQVAVTPASSSRSPLSGISGYQSVATPRTLR